MGIIWIIIGALLDFFGIIGFIMIAVGDAPPTSFVTSLVLSLLGIALIVLGVRLRMKRKIKRAAEAQTRASQLEEQKSLYNPPDPFKADTVSPVDGYGLLMINWKKWAMSMNSAVTILIDDEPVNMVFFSSDTTTMVPLLSGSHKVSTQLAFRKAETTITVVSGHCVRMELDYSRSAGNVRFVVHEGAEPADENSIRQAIWRLSVKRALLQAAYSYEKQGFPVLELTDTKAVILANKFERWLRMGIFPILIFAILPWLILRIMTRALSKRTILELQADGTIASRTGR